MKSTLSPRQQQVLKLIAEGKNRKEAAFAIKLSPKTIDDHLLKVKRRLGIYSVALLVQYALKHRIARFMIVASMLIAGGCAAPKPKSPPIPPSFSKIPRRAMDMSLVPPSGPGVTLAWIADTDPLITAYGIHWGGVSLAYTNSVTVGPATNTTARIGPLVAGATYYFAATSKLYNGLEGDYSPEVSYTVPVSNLVYLVQVQSAINLNGPFTNFRNALGLTNSPDPKMYFRLQINVLK